MGTTDARALARPAQFDEAEWQLRLALAACYRAFDALGWTESIFNHITVRVPGPERHYLINPWGLAYDEVTASNLVKVDPSGAPVGGAHGVNPAGFIIHSAIHGARDDAHCVMHTHTTAGMAIACKAEGLRFDNFYSAQLAGRVSYHEFEGITVHAAEQRRLVASLADKTILVLRNHGLLVAERDIPSAFLWMWTLQRACEVQCQADALPGANRVIPDEVMARAQADAQAFDGSCSALGQKMMDAILRRVERRAAPGWIDWRQ